MAEPHEINRRYWDAQAGAWRDLRDRDGLWRICPERPGARAGWAPHLYDIHPFQRPWRDQVEPLAMAKSYWDSGPCYEEDRFIEGEAVEIFGSRRVDR